MRLPWFTGLVTACVFVVRPVLAEAASPEDCEALRNKPVMVTLTDGRTPRGILSPKSGNDSVVLITELPGIAIESRFAWHIVAALQELAFSDPKPLPRPADPIPDEEAIDLAPHRNATEDKASSKEAADAQAVENGVAPWPVPVAPVPLSPARSAPVPMPPAPAPPVPMPPEARLPIESGTPHTVGLFPVESAEIVPVDALPELEVWPELVALDPRQAVRSLTIKAEVANWDRDAEIDGLLLRVQPLDGFGNVVPVAGNLDVQLATETKLWTGGHLVGDLKSRRDNSFRATERWSVPIHAIDFDATGTVVRLPFRRFHPERHFDIAPDALAFARLRLPSAGTFDASDPFVQLRPASRFRDDLQLHQNRRLLPFEGTPRW